MYVYKRRVSGAKVTYEALSIIESEEQATYDRFGVSVEFSDINTLLVGMAGSKTGESGPGKSSVHMYNFLNKLQRKVPGRAVHRPVQVRTSRPLRVSRA